MAFSVSNSFALAIWLLSKYLTDWSSIYFYSYEAFKYDVELGVICTVVKIKFRAVNVCLALMYSFSIKPRSKVVTGYLILVKLVS